MAEPPRAAPREIPHATVLSIAVPIILSNLTTPLIGIVDTAVLGQLEGAHHVGASIGAKSRGRFARSVLLSSLWAGIIAMTLGAALYTFGGHLIDRLSVDSGVREAARAVLPWAALMPVLGVAAYQLDGIYIGATRTADMRNMMLVGTAAFFAAWHILVPLIGNDGRWLSLLALNIVRTASLALRYPALVADASPIRTAGSPSARRAAR
ncbi:MAG: hypothetical protein KJ622_18265 [Alphaproteobacteria bacterium]|nr:hypothetical protein [Alphaproteobacteria bacterium]